LSDNTYARTLPTWIPNSLGLQDYEIIDLIKNKNYIEYSDFIIYKMKFLFFFSYFKIFNQYHGLI